MVSKRNDLVFISFAHPVENVPPPVNCAKVLSDNGYKVVLLGYQKNGKRKIEKIGKHAVIFRASLKSSAIKFGPLRKLCVVFEFIGLTVKLNNRLRPRAFIAFNEVSAIANRFLKFSGHKMNWLLEYPENETRSMAEGWLKNMSVKSWHKATVNIFPTTERMAMASVLNPRITEARMVVVHNAPSLGEVSPVNAISERSLTAINFLRAVENNLRIVYTGAVGNRYGWDSLIRAVADKPNIRLLILGAKHELGETEFAAAIRGTKYPENIMWLEAIPYAELQTIIRAADVGFVTYRGDTLNTVYAAPGKLYEYLKAGLVVMTDSNSCIADYIRSYKCGVFFEKPFDAGDISEVLDKIQLSEISAMKASSQNLFRQHFNMEMQMETILKLLR